MKGLARFIGRIPFIGKLPMSVFVFDLYQSATYKDRQWEYAKLVSLLVVYVILHSAQVIVGIESFGFDSPIWAKAISVAYIVVNFCIVLTQIYLCYRVTRFYFKGVYSRTERSYVWHSFGEIAAMLIVTIIGQGVFLIQFLWFV